MKQVHVVALGVLAAASACGTAPSVSTESCFPYGSHLRVGAQCRGNRQIEFSPLKHSNGELDPFDVAQWLSSASPPTISEQLSGCSLRIGCGEVVRADAAYREACLRSTDALLAELSAHWNRALCPIDPSTLRYEQGGGCYDTFIPGREAADCFEDFNTTIVLRAASECGSSSAEPGSSSPDAAQPDAAADRQRPRSDQPRAQRLRRASRGSPPNNPLPSPTAGLVGASAAPNASW